MVQRAVNEGEMTQAEVAGDKRRTRSAWQHEEAARDVPSALPAALLALVAESLRLQDRIGHMDTLIGDPPPDAVGTGAPRRLESQMLRLRAAFCV